MASASPWTPSRHHIPNETVVHDAQLTNYLAASAIAILLADYFATVQEEIDFVWKRWTVPSILYLWNRYMTVVTVISGASVMFREIKSDNVSGFNVFPIRQLY
ncbi:hypothetical protein DFH06DRAFT_524425 [Mycena polygramma]|nr:hypothetical protein DFH06DRAFT_524425 [Mycena polygramma]